jgi:hypothetical protein
MSTPVPEAAALAMDGACHCGGVRFSVVLSEGLANPRRCNCSLCRMRGAVVVTARHGDLTLTAGEDLLCLYRFNTGKAEHYFCSNCGIYTHHRRRSNPTQLSVNTACLKGVSPFDFAHVPVFDGVTHPEDRADGAFYQVAGYLDYRAAPGKPPGVS